MLNGGKKIRSRVVLADDHPEILEDLRALVEREFEVIATVGDGHALVAAIERRPRCHCYRHCHARLERNRGGGPDPRE